MVLFCLVRHPFRKQHLFVVLQRIGHFQIIIQYQKLIIPCIVSFKFEMIANNKACSLQKLYLREFFMNFFSEQSHLQMVNAFVGGLEVIENLIRQFEMRWNFASHNKKGSFDGGEIKAEAISQELESIYWRLTRIFKEIQPMQPKQPFIEDLSLALNEQSCTMQVKTDDELYQMLHQYQTQNKRLKEVKHKLDNSLNSAHTENCQLKSHILNLQTDVENKKNAIQTTTAQLQESINQIQILNHQIFEMELQKNELDENLTKVKAQNLELQNLSDGFEQMKIQLREEVNKNKVMREKIANFDRLIEAKLKEKESYMQEIINKAINSDEIYNKAACQSFRKFTHAMNKTK